MNMSKRSGKALLQEDEAPFIIKHKPVPFEFILDAISPLSPRTRPMFGCVAIYLGDKIVFVLRDKPAHSDDNGLWLATTQEHHESLRREFPNMRSIRLLGKEVTGWQLLPADAPDFEEAALRACKLILARDTRIGKVPKPRRASRLKSKQDGFESRAAVTRLPSKRRKPG